MDVPAPQPARCAKFSLRSATRSRGNADPDAWKPKRAASGARRPAAPRLPLPLPAAAPAAQRRRRRRLTHRGAAVAGQVSRAPRSPIFPASTPDPRCGVWRANSISTSPRSAAPAKRAASPRRTSRRPSARRRRPAGQAAAGFPKSPSSTSPNSVRSRPSRCRGSRAFRGRGCTRSWVNIPHVTHSDEADITELDAFRKELDDAAKADKKAPYRVSLLPLLMKACGRDAEGVPDLQRVADARPRMR